MYFASINGDILLVLQKKSKKKSTTSDEADERPVFVTLADVDVDKIFASTSICDDIPSQECFIAAEQSVEEQNQQSETNDADENDTDEQQALGKYNTEYLVTYVWSAFGSVS